jgi:hypothetical protein
MSNKIAAAYLLAVLAGDPQPNIQTVSKILAISHDSDTDLEVIEV